MDLTPTQSVDTLGIDQRWIGSTHGLDNGETATLTTATLQSAANALGILPSGVALGKITASDTLGLFDATANDGRQNLYGFLLSDEKIANGATAITKVGCSVLRHGTVRLRFLPVVAQRATVVAADTLGHFLFRP